MLWILVGLALGLGIAFPLGLRRGRRNAKPPPVDSAPRLEAEFAHRVVSESQTPLNSIAIGIGRELADLATAVQGNAQLLCEVLGEPELVAHRCERLWNGCDRLRLLTEKILTFARESRVERVPIDVRRFLGDLRRHVESVYGGSPRVHVATAPFLPPALGHERSLRNSLLFVIETLLDLEPRTCSLQIAAYADVAEDETTSIGIEICAEAAECDQPPRMPKEALQLGYLAARRSLEAQGAHLTIQQIAGLSATGLISLEADVAAIVPAEDEPAPGPQPTHEFGGVLVLVRDPTIRGMIATEIERRERKIIACADGPSARALLEATPERIELMIVESYAPHDGGRPVANHALALNPDIKVLLLQGVEDTNEERVEGKAVRTITKPFDALELRAELDSLLATSETRSSD